MALPRISAAMLLYSLTPYMMVLVRIAALDRDIRTVEKIRRDGNGEMLYEAESLRVIECTVCCWLCPSYR